MSEPREQSGFLTETCGKPSSTRLMGFVFLALFVLFAYMAITRDSDRAEEFASWCFVGSIAPQLIKKVIERFLAKGGAPS